MKLLIFCHLTSSRLPDCYSCQWSQVSCAGKEEEEQGSPRLGPWSCAVWTWLLVETGGGSSSRGLTTTPGAALWLGTSQLSPSPSPRIAKMRLWHARLHLPASAPPWARGRMSRPITFVSGSELHPASGKHPPLHQGDDSLWLTGPRRCTHILNTQHHAEMGGGTQASWPREMGALLYPVPIWSQLRPEAGPKVDEKELFSY